MTEPLDDPLQSGHSACVIVYAPYPSRPPLDQGYFEDSFVLNIAVEPDSALVRVEAAMTPQHPDFGPPRPGDQYRYEDIVLRFTSATTVPLRAVERSAGDRREW